LLMNSGATAPEWGASLASLLTTGGDIPYASSAYTPAALAKGAANLKMFMNAGATAPEWAGGLKIGSFTRDISTATGTQAVSGVGFKPSVILFIQGQSGGTPNASIGFSDGTSHYSVLSDYHTAGTWHAGTFCIYYYGSTGPISYTGTVSSLDADGFTVSWIKTGSPTGTIFIYYLALR
jgi:hypothetical protein